MTQVTTDQINKLRTRPHNTKLWLSIYQPPTILSAQVNDGSISKGAREITYNNDSGDYNDIKYGMTMYVGSSAGATDKGKIRVKSADASKVNVAENSHIDWADDDYLTVVNFFEINAIYPRIIQDPADETKTIWYKDYDIAYNNQNSWLGTFICMGSHYAGFLNGTGTCDVYYTSTGTNYLLTGSSSSHWLFEGGTPTGSSADTPGYVTYDAPGHYTTTFIVSGSAGGVDASYRHISIYDHPEDGINVPILSWELLDLAGDRDSGGYLANIRLRQNIDNSDLVDGALVVIFAEDWYDMEKVSLGGNSENRETIFFVGYIIAGSIRYNWLESYVEFQIGSPTEIMKEAEGFSISVEDSRDPLAWYNAYPEKYPSPWMLLLDMDIRRALYHYIRWHSTIIKCCDFQFLGTDKDIQYFDSDRSSLYDALQTLLSGTLLGHIVSDRQGKIWSEIDIYTEQSPYITSNLNITKRDWVETPDITERLMDDVSFMEAGGIYYVPGMTTGSSTPLLCQAPGEAPAYRGSIERFQGLALSSQGQLNQIIGDLFAYKNAQYPDITLNMAGNYRNFDIAPQEKVLINIPATDTVRGVVINSNFFINSMDWKYNPNSELLYPFVSFHEIVDEFDADTLTIPAIPPTEVEGGGTIDVPPIQVPPLPSPIPSPIAGTLVNIYDEGLLVGTADTLDFIGDPEVQAHVTGTYAFIVHGEEELAGQYNCKSTWILTGLAQDIAMDASKTSSRSIIEDVGDWFTIDTDVCKFPANGKYDVTVRVTKFSYAWTDNCVIAGKGDYIRVRANTIIGGFNKGQSPWMTYKNAVGDVKVVAQPYTSTLEKNATGGASLVVKIQAEFEDGQCTSGASVVTIDVEVEIVVESRF